MRIGFIERLAAQAMGRKGWSRDKVLSRHAVMWAIMAAICLAIWLFAPIEDLSYTRRGTEVPLPFLMIGLAILLGLLAAATWISKFLKG